MCVSGAKASEHHMIDTLGTSSKGQYVALEEYGYKAQTHTYFVNIRIINVWTNQFEGSPVRVEDSAKRPATLAHIRNQAKLLATKQLLHFKIPM